MVVTQKSQQIWNVETLLVYVDPSFVMLIQHQANSVSMFRVRWCKLTLPVPFMIGHTICNSHEQINLSIAI